MALFDLQEPAALRIREAATRGTLSHALLLTGSGQRLELARYAAAALECEAEGNRPCGVCRACRKVEENIHPDVITVQDDQHKNIGVAVIREMRSDAYIRPNEGRRKVYLFPDCSLLTEQDQNVLLKIVEEGPAYAAFIFCTPTAHMLLPTIRSRCVEMHVTGEEQEVSSRAAALCRVLTEGDDAVLQHLVSLENSRMKREELLETVDGAWYLTAEALLIKSGKPGGDEVAALLSRSFSVPVLNALNSVFDRYRGECRYNVNVGAVLGAMIPDLRRGLRGKV